MSQDFNVRNEFLVEDSIENQVHIEYSVFMSMQNIIFECTQEINDRICRINNALSAYNNNDEQFISIVKNFYSCFHAINSYVFHINKINNYKKQLDDISDEYNDELCTNMELLNDYNRSRTYSRIYEDIEEEFFMCYQDYYISRDLEQFFTDLKDVGKYYKDEFNKAKEYYDDPQRLEPPKFFFGELYVYPSEAISNRSSQQNKHFLGTKNTLGSSLHAQF